jgi:membrane protein DedA with SNARE-associated domain
VSHIFEVLTNFVVQVISGSGYAGVVVLMAIESAAIPLPSEIIMPFAGFLASQGRFNLWGLALAGGIGNVLGSVITYWLGRYGGRPLIERYGKYVLITKHDLDTAERFFNRFGSPAIFLARLLPAVRTFISIPAGIAREPFVPFVIYSFLGSFLWSLLLAYLGMRLGPQWGQLRQQAHGLDYVVGAFIAAGVIWWIQRHRKHRQA